MGDPRYDFVLSFVKRRPQASNEEIVDAFRARFGVGCPAELYDRARRSLGTAERRYLNPAQVAQRDTAIKDMLRANPDISTDDIQAACKLRFGSMPGGTHVALNRMAVRNEAGLVHAATVVLPADAPPPAPVPDVHTSPVVPKYADQRALLTARLKAYPDMANKDLDLATREHGWALDSAMARDIRRELGIQQTNPRWQGREKRVARTARLPGEGGRAHLMRMYHAKIATAEQLLKDGEVSPTISNVDLDKRIRAMFGTGIDPTECRALRLRIGMPALRGGARPRTGPKVAQDTTVPQERSTPMTRTKQQPMRLPQAMTVIPAVDLPRRNEVEDLARSLFAAMRADGIVELTIKADGTLRAMRAEETRLL